MTPLILAIVGVLIGLTLAYCATGGYSCIVTTYAWHAGPIGRLRFVLYWLAILMMVASGSVLVHLAMWGTI